MDTATSSPTILPTLLTLVAQVCLALLFGLAAIGKLLDLAGFERAVLGYKLLPERSARPLARVMIGLELGVAASFATGFAVRWAAVVALALLAAFSLAALLNLGRGRRVACGCHTPGGTGLIGWGLVARNLLLALLAVALVTLARPGVGAAALLRDVILPGGRLDEGAVAVTVLLCGFCLTVVPLVEWAVDIHLRFAQLAVSSEPRRSS